jgi:zinc D-Ala-D-Ala carboxypeptidase
MRLSKNFSLSEFIGSQMGERAGLDNQPDQAQTENIRLLVENILQPLRDAMEEPLYINSGFRSPEVNRLVGGALNSQHLTGLAADIEIVSIDNKELAQYIIDLGLPFDQLILEFYDRTKGPNTGWVHVSYDPQGGRGEVLSAKHNPQTRKTEYFPGLID